MIVFALTEMLDEQAYNNYLLEALHPDGLHCPKVIPYRMTKPPTVENVRP